MLDSAVVDNASKARPTVRNAIEWALTAWNELSVSTVKNCWNHAKILPRPVTSGPVDATIDELSSLLIEFADSSLDVDSLVNHASEKWTEEPESDDEEASSISMCLYAGENFFPSAPSKSFPRCTDTLSCGR